MSGPNEFVDLMPHVIKVHGESKPDVYGKTTPNVNVRQYRCLIDDATTVVRNSSGEEVTVALTAYVWPVPIDSQDDEPVDIESDEIVDIITPRPQTRTLVAVERHYDSENSVGYLHNIVLRFT